MKAFLLAAGLGKRLRPVTDTTPKCLVPVAGEPLLAIWLRLLREHGVGQVLLNTHYLAGQVAAFVENWAGEPEVTLSYEETLLGSAGTIARNWGFVEGERDFLVCYADNLTDIDVSRMLAFHRRHDAMITMATFRSESPSECGVVEFRDDGRVVSFEEKPVAPRSSHANAGVYVMSSRVRAMLPARTPADIGYDLLPACLGNLRAWPWDGVLVDIGSPQAYAHAQTVWKARKTGP